MIAVALLRPWRGTTEADEDLDETEQDPDALTEEDTTGWSEDDENADEDDEDVEEDDGDDWDEDAEEPIEEIPLTSAKAKITDLRIEQRSPGLYADPRDQLRFIADFQVSKREPRSMEIPEELYDKLKIGERATLITQGNLFIDFGDRYAEPAET